MTVTIIRQAKIKEMIKKVPRQPVASIKNPRSGERATADMKIIKSMAAVLVPVSFLGVSIEATPLIEGNMMAYPDMKQKARAMNCQD